MLLATFTTNAFANMAIWFIIVATIIGLVLIFLKYVLKWEPPQWFWAAVGLVIGAIIIIFLIVLLVHISNQPGPMFGYIVDRLRLAAT